MLADTIKTYMSALSLYYSYDIEDFARKQGLNYLLKVLKDNHADKYIIDYLKYLIDLFNFDKTKADISFREYTEFLSLPTIREKENLARILHR